MVVVPAPVLFPLLPPPQAAIPPVKVIRSTKHPRTARHRRNRLGVLMSRRQARDAAPLVYQEIRFPGIASIAAGRCGHHGECRAGAGDSCNAHWAGRTKTESRQMLSSGRRRSDRRAQRYVAGEPAGRCDPDQGSIPRGRARRKLHGHSGHPKAGSGHRRDGDQGRRRSNAVDGSTCAVGGVGGGKNIIPQRKRSGSDVDSRGGAAESGRGRMVATAGHRDRAGRRFGRARGGTEQDCNRQGLCDGDAVSRATHRHRRGIERGRSGPAEGDNPGRVGRVRGRNCHGGSTRSRRGRREDNLHRAGSRGANGDSQLFTALKSPALAPVIAMASGSNGADPLF